MARIEQAGRDRRECLSAVTSECRGVTASPALALRHGFARVADGWTVGPLPERSAPIGIVVGRYQGTVVVTIHGELDLPRVDHLGHVLVDLIDGQGNLAVIVDLRDATATDSDRASVFADVAERARRHGAELTLSEPPASLHGALARQGLGHLVAPAPGAPLR